MLFTQPIPVSGANRPMAAPVARVRTPGLGFIFTSRNAFRPAFGRLPQRDFRPFLAGMEEVKGTRLTAIPQLPAVYPVPGWFRGRRPEIFLAERKGVLGTAPLTLLNRVVRAASGWLSARTSRLFVALESGTPVGASPLTLLRPQTAEDSGPPASGDVPHYHLSVLPDEVSEWMAAGPDRFIIDGTLGGGGHTGEFLAAGARVLGVDRDPEALAHARKRLAAYGDRFTTWEGNFADVEDSPEIRKGERADGLLLDLGVSSRQLDAAERGFSFMREGPLDMRMGPSSPRTAADIVNGWGETELAKLIYEFGEEPKSRRIAAAIVERRSKRRFDTTLDLADCIERAIGRQGRTHPATRTFQAIRMAVNEELESLARALEASVRILKPGGRLLVITFHSLEDRLVKRFLKHRSTAWLDEPGWPEPRPNPEYHFRLLSRKAVAPAAAETSRNPRARSAKLRVAELLIP